MGSRTDLQTILETQLGSENVYFQPPPSTQMLYPCIVFQLSNADTKFADNIPYRYEKRYQVTVIDRNPDSAIPDKIAFLPKCIFDRFFVADNLNHHVFSIWF